MKTYPVLIALALLAGACLSEDEPKVAQTTTILISGPQSTRKAVEVEAFRVVPATLDAPRPVRAEVTLENPVKGTQLSLDWFGPDGWLRTWDMRPAAAETVTFTAPAATFDDPGRYRAVLRSGRKTVAEASVTVGS